MKKVAEVEEDVDFERGDLGHHLGGMHELLWKNKHILLNFFF